MAVDDEDNILNSLRRLFKTQFGEHVHLHAFADPKEALAFAASTQLDAVISDQTMPAMHGDALLTQIHSIQPLTPLIMLSARAELSELANAVNNACLFKFLFKPWNENELAGCVLDAFLAKDKAQELRDADAFTQAALDEQKPPEHCPPGPDGDDTFPRFVDPEGNPLPACESDPGPEKA